MKSMPHTRREFEIDGIIVKPTIIYTLARLGNLASEKGSLVFQIVKPTIIYTLARLGNLASEKGSLVFQNVNIFSGFTIMRKGSSTTGFWKKKSRVNCSTRLIDSYVMFFIRIPTTDLRQPVPFSECCLSLHRRARLRGYTGYGISALSESEREGVEVQSLSQFDTKTIAYLAPGHSCWNRQIALTCVKLCQVIWSPPVRTNSFDVTVLESSPTVFLAPPKLSLSDSWDAQQNPQFHSVVWGQRWGLLPCKRHPNGYRLP